MDLSPGSSRGPEMALAGWMVSVFIGNLILAWGGVATGFLQSERGEGELAPRPNRGQTPDAKSAEFAEKKGESQPPLADRTWGLQRKSESFALALKGGLYGGTVFLGEHETKCGERFRRKASYYW